MDCTAARGNYFSINFGWSLRGEGEGQNLNSQMLLKNLKIECWWPLKDHASQIALEPRTTLGPQNRYILNLELRDCQQITLITRYRFYPLSKPSPTPCSQWIISKWIEYQPKSNEKYMPFYTVFEVLKVYMPYKNVDVVFISFYISRYHCSQLFRTSFIIIWQKIFAINCLF